MHLTEGNIFILMEAQRRILQDKIQRQYHSNSNKF